MKNEKHKENAYCSVKDWKGKNYFWCCGSGLSGREGFYPSMFLFIMLSVPTVIYGIFEQKLIREFYLAAPIAFAALFCGLALIFLFMSSYSDPGMLKHNDINLKFSDKTVLKVVHKGIFKHPKICPICKIIRPFRTYHCPSCNNCVLKFENHQYWLGNCVGKGNNIFVYVFLILITISEMIQIAFSVLYVYIVFREDRQDRYITMRGYRKTSFYLTKCIAPAYVCVYSAVIFGITFSLFCDMTCRICMNITSIERKRHAFRSLLGNIYSKRGCIYNWSIFCNRELPYYNTLKQLKYKRLPIYTEEDAPIKQIELDEDFNIQNDQNYRGPSFSIDVSNNNLNNNNANPISTDRLMEKEINNNLIMKSYQENIPENYKREYDYNNSINKNGSYQKTSYNEYNNSINLNNNQTNFKTHINNNYNLSSSNELPSKLQSKNDVNYQISNNLNINNIDNNNDDYNNNNNYNNLQNVNVFNPSSMNNMNNDIYINNNNNINNNSNINNNNNNQLILNDMSSDVNQPSFDVTEHEDNVGNKISIDLKNKKKNIQDEFNPNNGTEESVVPPDSVSSFSDKENSEAQNEDVEID